MKRLLEIACPWLLLIAMVLCLLLAWGLDHFKDQAQTVGKQLQQLQSQVATQNQTARAQLDRLTAERDAAQAQLDAQFQQQEKTDAQTIQEIARLTDELQQRPVRVRLATTPGACGPSGGGPPGAATASTDAGATDPAPTYGLLPAANSQRLGAVIQEVETLNAAYASCRALCMQP